MKKLIIATASLLGITNATAVHAEDIVRHRGAAQSPILSGVSIPANASYLYLSGQVPASTNSSLPATDPAAYGDTKAQAISVFEKIKALLEAQGYKLGDVIKLTVFLVGDPNQGGKQDFKGFSEAYGQYFGTATQPNIVARSTVQVAALANPAYLIEIEATAAKVK